MKQKSQPIRQQTKKLSNVIDKDLTLLWNIPDALLIATGGYGRGELFPRSDIDILILTESPTKLEPQISAFIQSAWAKGLKISHSVRSPRQAINDTFEDLALYTSFLESRLLAGSQSIFYDFHHNIKNQNAWPDRKFLQQKIKEQQIRHEKYRDNLEPNIKNCLGGLRDIQTLYWLMLKTYGSPNFKKLVEDGLIKPLEVRQLRKAHIYLSKVRFGLQQNSKTGETLRFDIQLVLAEQYNYEDDHKQKAVEYFMKDLFLHLRNVICITEKVYTKLGYNPDAKFQEIQSVQFLTQAASEFKAIEFRSNLKVKIAFFDILNQEHGISHNLKHLSNTGVLSKLIPSYKHTIGQMQFDMFHIHSVDIHTLEVVRQLREMVLGEHKTNLALCTELLGGIKSHSTLYLAALFHDMGKGRGVDHSDWGANAAYTFLKGYPIPESDKALIAWIVQNHLIMSLTAQKEDISDLDVLSRFVVRIKDLKHLNHLYIFTIADIRGTNPKLWTGHKDSLLKHLYLRARDLITSQNTQNIKLIHEDLTQLLENHSSLATLISVKTDAKTKQCTLTLQTKRNRFVFANVTTAIDALGLNIASAETQVKDNSIAQKYVLLDKDNQTFSDIHVFKEIETGIRHKLDTGLKPVIAQRRKREHVEVFNITTSISIKKDIAKKRLIINLTTADRPGLLAKVAIVFAEFDLRLYRAKISTLGEKAEDVFWLTDNGTPTVALKKTLLEMIA